MAFDFGKIAGNVTSKVTKLGHEASAMTKNVADNVRINGAISEQKKIIEAMYSVIGKKYFEQFGNNPESEFVAEISNIKAAQEKIEALEKQLSEVKGTCPSCGAKLTPGAAFCVSCGAKLTKADSTANEASKDNKTESDENTVQNNTAESADSAAQSEAVNTADSAAQSEAVNTADSAAQGENSNTADTEVNYSEQDNAESQTAASTVVEGKVCPNCNIVYDSNVQFCTKCGTKLN